MMRPHEEMGSSSPAQCVVYPNIRSVATLQRSTWTCSSKRATHTEEAHSWAGAMD